MKIKVFKKKKKGGGGGKESFAFLDTITNE